MSGSVPAVELDGSLTDESLALTVDDDGVVVVARKHRAATPVHKDEMRRAAFVIAAEVRHVERILEHDGWNLTLYDSAVADLLEAADRLRKIARKVREEYVPPEQRENNRGGW